MPLALVDAINIAAANSAIAYIGVNEMQGNVMLSVLLMGIASMYVTNMLHNVLVQQSALVEPAWLPMINYIDDILVQQINGILTMLTGNMAFRVVEWYTGTGSPNSLPAILLIQLVIQGLNAGSFRAPYTQKSIPPQETP
jgi:hypothetical protein